MASIQLLAIDVPKPAPRAVLSNENMIVCLLMAAQPLSGSSQVDYPKLR